MKNEQSSDVARFDWRELVGGRLRLLDQAPEADGRRSRAIGVIDADGAPIGWTMAAISGTESANYRTYKEADRG